MGHMGKYGQKWHFGVGLYFLNLYNGFVKREEISIKTKTTLADSLKKLMNKKSLSKITVNEIITEANVNRKTFYYHFTDIYDLVRWIIEQDAFNVVKQFDITNDYEEMLEFVINYVKENEYLLNCAYDTIGKDQLKRFFYNDFASLVENTIDEAQKQYSLKVNKETKEFLCSFFTEAIAGSLVDAFQKRKNPDKSQITKNIKILIDSLPDILKRAAKNQPNTL